MSNTGDFHAINAHYRNPNPSGLTLSSATLNGIALNTFQIDSIRLGTGSGLLIKSQDPTGTRTQAATGSGVLYKDEAATLVLTYSGATGTAPYIGQGFIKYNGVQILNLPNDELPTNNPATPAANDATTTPGCFTITGTVFNDMNGGTTPDGSVPTTSVPIYVNVIDPATGNVVASVTVNPGTGTYTVPSLNPGNYTIQLTQVQGVAGNPKPATMLPDGFAHLNTSIGNSTAPDDGNITNGETPVTVGSVNLTGVNFGIEQAPESIAGAKSITGAPQNGTTYSLEDTPLRGSDPQDQPAQGSWAGKTIIIDSLPTNGFELIYDGITITTPGFRIPGYDPAKLSIKATAVPGGTSSTRFYFSSVDLAGVKDPSPAAFNLNFSTALPVVFGIITATLTDEQLVINWQTLTEKNCSHYEIEASKDGIHFLQIGEVKTLAPGGNSDQALSYNFSKTFNGTMMWGVTLFTLGLLLLLGMRRNKWLHLSMLWMGMGIFAVSCNKNTKDLLSDSHSQLFFRIKQVDINGDINYSKVIQVHQK
ncbi:hypothetical protein [Niabella hibiscisoli]|uniref:hypothetical protein n=1 Tax=Niabella hibiscisoli TaxID=1825928 RepID=UPI001F0DDFED|nr:hypothetical protein [Niabella hibiscisoli]MCH5719291.1 hypothetical protein [Niabella hibiscisoli]